MNAWTRIARHVVAAPIVAYRRVLSPLKPPTCRFSPTCSAYAHEAILRLGVLRGTRLALWRVLRCQPFCRGGYDPVPAPKPRGRCGAGESAPPLDAGDPARPTDAADSSAP